MHLLRPSCIITLVVMAGIGIVWPVLPANALMVPMSLEDLARQSDTIIKGKILTASSFMEDQKIYTEYTISVEGTFLGTPSRTMTIRLLGGELEDGLGMSYSDRPKITLGEDLILFLRNDPVYPVVGEFQGKCTIKDGWVLEHGMSENEFADRITEVLRRLGR